ncbi:MAG: sensor histidine kinase [Chthoniobacterales bacterium]
MRAYLFSHALYLTTMAAFFVVDILLPRGATAAIGYCLIPVLARKLGDRRFLIVVTGICTMLTWIGFLFESPGAASWMSAFDRAMVTGVLWLTLLLVRQQMEAEIALTNQAQALQNAVDELHRSNTELENFASVVSHDIRGPLNAVEFAIQLVSARPAIKSDAKCKEWFDSISAEITRMSDLVETLLAYGRVGAAAVNLSECDCESVLAVVRRALRAELENAGAEITNDPLPVIRADPVLLDELFQNLIENGIKYRQSAPPRIHVSATVTSEGWRFSISDNGIGMSPGECAQVFDPFYRGTAAASSPGFGLGLATCKRIVDRHGGRIEAQSDRGHGSTFSFVIPAPETGG